jgi:phosphoenolpyruvate-protein phosphotransferase
MIQLTPQNIRIGARAGTKNEAIRAAGQVLVESGFIEPGYIESMIGREGQANTYLGNGISIPHGMAKDRELIRATGISVVQLPEGVEWGPGKVAHLIVGIAAKSDEHLGVLAALTDVLDDPGKAQLLAKTKDPSDIIAGLSREAAQPGAEPEGAPPPPGAHHVDAKIVGSAGMHARPATVFADLASEFQSDIRVQYGTKIANGKSMAAILKLGTPCGQAIRIIASGPDAEAALKALKEAVDSGLGDVEEIREVITEADKWVPVSGGHALTGVSASPGIAIGPVYQFQTTHIVVEDKPQDPESEKLALKRAIAAANEQITDIYDQVSKQSGKGQAAIFRAHLALLNDAEIFQEVSTHIEAGHSAAWSWQHAIERRSLELKQIENERLAERAADLHDIGQRVLRLLAGAEHGAPRLPDHPVILVADDLTPSDTAQLDPKRILGLCTASGGPTAHTAIIARSLDIPCVVGAGAAVLEVTSEQTCILDGSAGKLYIEPNAEDVESAKRFQVDLANRRNEEYSTRYEPAVFADGHRVEVVGNIGKAAEATAAVEAGAEGIGLMRTEFLFLERDTPPSEDEQYEAYSEMTRALNGLPLILRTLDIGGDKIASYISLAKEENPFLGVRGIRLCLRQPGIFLPQLRAIYRASTTGPIKIMFPMISTLEELHEAKQVAEQVRQELGVAPVEIGIMVEVPSTVLMAAEFAKHVDFFSVGTNDLTQYTLAMDRMHAALAKNVDGLHPAILRMIDMTVRAAKGAGKWVGVCGGVAGDPLGAAILSGLGVAELSMSLPSIAAVKSSLRKIKLADAEKLARRALACSTAAEVRQLSH